MAIRKNFVLSPPQEPSLKERIPNLSQGWQDALFDWHAEDSKQQLDF